MPSWNKHRRDVAQKPLIEALKRSGYSVLDISQVGGSAPDLVIARAGHTTLVEVKTGKAKARANQHEFAKHWHGELIVASDIDQILSYTRG